ncbi:hypothetical protein BH09ACT3_BH09ACT3_14030 [soil metagenome]
MSETECIHGLAVGLCDLCSPKPTPVEEKRSVPLRRSVPARRNAVRSVVVAPVDRGEQRIYFVSTIDDLGELLSDGHLGELNFYDGPEDLAWQEHRRAPGVLEQVVLVSTRRAVSGQSPVPFAAIQLVAVANSRGQERVKELLAASEFSARVSIHPPWFQSGD